MKRIPGLFKRSRNGFFILGLFLVLCSGCNMDDGYSGETSPSNLYLKTQGCITDEPQTVKTSLPFDVQQVDLTLEVLRTQVDLIFGEDTTPSSYFSYGPAPGVRKIRVGKGSYKPLHAGSWFVKLVGLSGETGECDATLAPDWRLRVQRAQSLSGIDLLNESCDSAECQVPACTNSGNCPDQEFSFDLPEDAVSLEVVLESLSGNADLFLGTASEEDLYISTNSGTGFDIVTINSQAIAPLRGQTLSVRLESWGEATQEFRLRAVYLPGVVEEAALRSAPP